MQDRAGGQDTRKVVTVLFCDLVGSTAMGESLDPETTRSIVSRYFDVAREVLERHGGSVEKFIGDAVMAVFGVPTLHEDDALRAVRAAADMRLALDALNRELQAGHGLGLRVRIGIDTGPAAVGSGGDQQLVTGPAVNRAARLEQIAGPGDVLLGQDTYRLVRSAVDAEALGPVDLKGAAGPVEAWRLLAVHPDAQAIERRADIPFVGRSDELARLETAFATAVTDHTCTLVTVVGPPGIGKSRLGLELATRLDGRADVLVGRCLPYGEGITYSALGEILGQVGAPIHDLLAADGDDAALIESLVTRAVDGADGAGSPDETAWAFRRVIEAVARRRPTVVVIDDLHWANPSLIDLLEYVLLVSTGVPLLLVCLTRHDLFDSRPSWAAPRPNATLLSLDPLSADDTRRLVDGMIDLPDLAPELRSRIVERAAGNPLFVEQLLAMLADRADAGDGAELPVPPTIRALLAARVDRLPAPERTVVQAASIEGWVFRRTAVAALLGADARDGLAGYLMALVRKDFIRPDRTAVAGEDAFRFNHVLIRDAAYEAISKAERARQHERYADWLEDRADDQDEVAEAVGYHLAAASRFRREVAPGEAATVALARRAGRAVGIAGRRAGARGDATAAIGLLTDATELLRVEPAARLDLLPDLGQALLDGGDLATAERVLGEAVAEARIAGDERNKLRAEIERWRVLTMSAAVEPDGPLDTARRAIATFERVGDRAGASAAWFLRASYATEWADRVEAFERARDEALAAGDDRRMVDVWNEYGGAMLFGPTPYPEVIAFIEDEMAWAKDRGYPGVEADACLMGPYCYPLIGRWDEARSLLERSKLLAEELGIRYGLAEACWAGAQMEMLAGDLEAAEREMRRAVTIHEEIGATRYVAMVRAHLAHVLIAQGRVDEAVAMIASARALEAGSGVRYEVYWRTAAAKAAVRAGGDGADVEAVRLARDAVEIVGASLNLNLHAEALVMLAEVAEATGDRPAAIASLAAARDLFERKGNDLLVERTARSLGRLAGRPVSGIA
ncbi:MAG TPA: adenylate/guanylate cyclase domain-containing protein [Candidatus Limnocylindrales bacterium]